MTAKNLFLTKTVLMGFFGMTAAASPILNSAISEGRWLTFTEWQGLAAAVVSFIGVCIGRHEATALTFTPKGLPGRNKEDADDVTSTLLHTAVTKLVPLVIEQFATTQAAATTDPSPATAAPDLSEPTPEPIAPDFSDRCLLHCLNDSWLLEEPGSPIEVSHAGKRVRAARAGLSYAIASTIVDENGWKRFTTLDDRLQWYGKTDDFQLV